MIQRKDDSRIELLLEKAAWLQAMAKWSAGLIVTFGIFLVVSLYELKTNVAVINTKLEAIVAVADEARKDIQQLQGKVFKENVAKSD
jgi:uncharacterized membrane protein